MIKILALVLVILLAVVLDTVYCITVLDNTDALLTTVRHHHSNKRS